MSVRKWFIYTWVALAFFAAPYSHAEEKQMKVSYETAAAFLPRWLGMIDNASPPADFIKYLPDGDFEEWSYPSANIKNLAELQAYFAKSYGDFKSNRNDIRKLTVTPAESGRYVLVAEAQWTAVNGAGQQIIAPLIYTLTIGSGISSLDKDGRFPKVYRYKIRPNPTPS